MTGRRTTTALLLGVTLLAGCSSTSTADSRSTAASSSATAATPEPTNTPPVAGGYYLQGDASDSDGDKLSVLVSFGLPVHANSVSSAVMAQCGDRLTAAGYSLSRSIALPSSVSVGNETSVATSAEVLLAAGVELVSSGGLVSAPDDTFYWAMNHKSGGECAVSGDYPDDAGVEYWSNLDHGARGNANGWIVLPNTITPDDPSGLLGMADDLLLAPTVRIGNNNAELSLLSSSTGVVNCSQPDAAAGLTPYLALAPSVAISQDCSRY